MSEPRINTKDARCMWCSGEPHTGQPACGHDPRLNALCDQAVEAMRRFQRYEIDDLELLAQLNVLWRKRRVLVEAKELN